MWSGKVIYYHWVIISGFFLSCFKQILINCMKRIVNKDQTALKELKKLAEYH